MTTVLTRDDALLIALGRVEAREEFADRIRAQLRAWAREATPLEPFPCGFVFQEFRALVNEVEADLHRSPYGRRSHHISAAKRKRILTRDRYTCQDCGFNPSTPHRDVLTIDHVIPRCEGGTSQDSNLTTLCQRCNSEKGRKLPELQPAAA